MCATWKLPEQKIASIVFVFQQVPDEVQGRQPKIVVAEIAGLELRLCFFPLPQAAQADNPPNTLF